MEQADHKDPGIGRIVAEKYKLLRVIGEGGMGKVYEAEHLGLGVKRAIKVMRGAPSEDGDTVQRFRREAQLPGKLHTCQNICHVYDLELSEDGSLCIIMEMLSGEDLGHRLQKAGRLTPDQWAPMLRQLAEVLDLVHEHGIVHRDLKPQNLFLHRAGSGNEVLKVLDFGIAKIVGAMLSLTAHGALMGTPLFMSPEQARGEAKEADHLSDIFSVGCISYFVLSGKYPFQAPTPLGIFYKIWFEEPPPLHEVVPGLPITVSDAVHKAMAKEPGDRYQTVAALVEDFCAGLPDTRKETPSLRPGVHLEPAVPTPPETLDEADSDSSEVDDPTIRDAEPSAVEQEADRMPTKPPRSPWRLPATVAALALAASIGGLAVWGWLVAEGWGPQRKPGVRQTDRKTDRGETKSQTSGSQPEKARDTSKPLPDLSFAIGYNAPSDLMFKEMGELVKYLSRRLGRRVSLVNVPPDRIAARLAAGTLDLGIFPPTGTYSTA